jgi:hypothetical protein
MYPSCSQEDLDRAWRLSCQDNVSTASGAAAVPAHDARASEHGGDRDRRRDRPRRERGRITLDVLTSAERRDLANSLLRAARSAVLARPHPACSTSSWKPTTRCPPTADDPTSQDTHCGAIVGRPPPGLQLMRRALRGHRSRPRARRVRTMPGGWNAMNDRRDGPRWP